MHAKDKRIVRIGFERINQLSSEMYYIEKCCGSLPECLFYWATKWNTVKYKRI